MKNIFLLLLIILLYSCKNETSSSENNKALSKMSIEVEPDMDQTVSSSTPVTNPTATPVTKPRAETRPADNSSKGYLRTQKLIKDNRIDIFRLVDNSQPVVKDRMTKLLNICIDNGEADFIRKSERNRSHMRKFMETVDFFISRIEEARSFKPNTSQRALYKKLKSLALEEKDLINKYINDGDSNFNHTDLQRIRMYKMIMDRDIDSYLANTVVTERDFNKNFNYMVDNWGKISLEMYTYYELIKKGQ